MNVSANVFLFGELQPHHQGWSPILVDLIDLLVFLSQMALLRWLTFLFGSLDCDSQIPCGFLSLFSF